MEFWGESQKDKENTDAVNWSPNSLRQAFLKGGDGTQSGVGDPLCLGMFLGGGGRGVQKRGDSFLTGMSKKRRAEKMEKSSEKESVPCL